ncbi:MAG: M18 family aminopeptidase [Eubacteriales bacterium]|nr:M18 family aminopeptidase [Eubacteriales bacterium]
MIKQRAEEFLDFVKNSPSCYHVIDNFRNMLNAAGYAELREECSWKLEKGGKYYCIRGGSSIIAFAVPKEEYTNFQVIAAHSDAPVFKIKENPEILTDGHYVELNVEKYGGMIYSTWLDRPLSLAGRVIVKNKDTFESRLINIDRDLLVIPNAAIHMNRDINDGYKYNAQKDMVPIFGGAGAGNMFNKLVAKEACTDACQIYGMDLYLYNRTKGSIWGACEEFISSPKIDDLECAYTAMKALLQAADADSGINKSSVLICAVFDNEEVGSQTKQGAASTFLYDVLTRIDEKNYRQKIAKGFMLSADNGHAVHPHHLDKADPTNRPYMNEGVVIKYNANQKYTTDALSAAVFKGICENADIPVQSYVNRSDIAGGSTLGNILSSQVSFDTVDIGAAQLAMHSAYETAGVKDLTYMLEAMKAFYNTHLEKDERGFVSIVN